MLRNSLYWEKSVISDNNSLAVPVNILVEGITDESVAKRLLEYVGLPIGTVFGRHGKDDLLRRLFKYNQAAHFAPWFVLVDLDNSKGIACVPQAIKIWLPQPAERMRLRVAVRAIEAWMMADAERLAAFLNVSLSKMTENPDRENDPKETLINIARSSTSRSIREDLVPRHGSGIRVGPLYGSRLMVFAENHWRPDEAAKHSDSLRRCIEALNTLKVEDGETS
jgi:hypothetical protein